MITIACMGSANSGKAKILARFAGTTPTIQTHRGTVKLRLIDCGENLPPPDNIRIVFLFHELGRVPLTPDPRTIIPKGVAIMHIYAEGEERPSPVVSNGEWRQYPTGNPDRPLYGLDNKNMEKFIPLALKIREALFPHTRAEPQSFCAII
jgi:hypothetical protein